MNEEKQIEEMAHIVSNSIKIWVCEAPPISNPHFVVAAIYHAGYRKQSEGGRGYGFEIAPMENPLVIARSALKVGVNMGLINSAPTAERK